MHYIVKIFIEENYYMLQWQMPLPSLKGQLMEKKYSTDITVLSICAICYLISYYTSAACCIIVCAEYYV